MTYSNLRKKPGLHRKWNVEKKGRIYVFGKMPKHQTYILRNAKSCFVYVSRFLTQKCLKILTFLLAYFLAFPGKILVVHKELANANLYFMNTEQSARRKSLR